MHRMYLISIWYCNFHTRLWLDYSKNSFKQNCILNLFLAKYFPNNISLIPSFLKVTQSLNANDTHKAELVVFEEVEKIDEIITEVED